VTIRWRPQHVRTRLTLWYVGVLSAVLALYIVSTLLFVYVSLRQQLDERLRAEFERVEDRLAEASGGTIGIDGHDEEGVPASLVEVWSPEGAVLYRSASLRGEALAPAWPTTTRDDCRSRR